MCSTLAGPPQGFQFGHPSCPMLPNYFGWTRRNKRTFAKIAVSAALWSKGHSNITSSVKTFFQLLSQIPCFFIAFTILVYYSIFHTSYCIRFLFFTSVFVHHLDDDDITQPLPAFPHLYVAGCLLRRLLSWPHSTRLDTHTCLS